MTRATTEPDRIEYIILDNELPADRLILAGVDMADSPTFTISEVAKFFFARTRHWIRWREKGGLFVYEGKVVGTQRTDKGARIYDLADVEKMAHALAAHDGIEADELTMILRLVAIEAKMYGLIP